MKVGVTKNCRCLSYDVVERSEKLFFMHDKYAGLAPTPLSFFLWKYNIILNVYI